VCLFEKKNDERRHVFRGFTFFSEYPAHNNPFLSSGRGKPLEKRFRSSRKGFSELFFLYETGLSTDLY